MPEIIKQFNWVDIFVAIVLFRVIYISIKTGLPIELFKILGTLSAIYLALHYYSSASSAMISALPLIKERVNVDFLNFVAFLILAIFGYIVFMALRMLFYRFMKMEAAPNLNKWGGLVLGIFRSFLLAGLLTYTLAICGIGYLKDSIASSYTASRVANIAPNTYSWLWSNIGSKFMPGDKFNEHILRFK